MSNDADRLRAKLDIHQFRINQILWLQAMTTYEMSMPAPLERFMEDIHQNCDRSIPPALLSVPRPASAMELFELLQDQKIDGYLMQIEQPQLLPDGLSFSWGNTDSWWVYGTTIADALRAAIARASERFPVGGSPQPTLFNV